MTWNQYFSIKIEKVKTKKCLQEIIKQKKKMTKISQLLTSAREKNSLVRHGPVPIWTIFKQNNEDEKHYWI